MKTYLPVSLIIFINIRTLLIIGVKGLGGTTARLALNLLTLHWSSKCSSVFRPAGDQAIPGIEMLPPARVHDPIRHFTEALEQFYLDREERGFSPTDRVPSQIPTRREYRKVICVATLLMLGLALVTFVSHVVGSIIHKALL